MMNVTELFNLIEGQVVPTSSFFGNKVIVHQPDSSVEKKVFEYLPTIPDDSKSTIVKVTNESITFTYEFSINGGKGVRYITSDVMIIFEDQTIL